MSSTQGSTGSSTTTLPACAQEHSRVEQQGRADGARLAQYQQQQIDLIHQAAEMQKRQLLGFVDDQARRQEARLRELFAGQAGGVAHPLFEATMDDRFRAQVAEFEEHVRYLWVYDPELRAPLDIRERPVVDGPRTGPFLKLPYKPNMKRRIGMIAGGSGITPMLQIITEVLKDPGDKTELTLVFGNQSPRDILIRAELDRLAESSGGQLKVLYVVDRNDTGDASVKHVGHVTREFLSAVLPAPSPDTLIFVCGPPPMVKALAGPKKFRKEDPNPRGHPFYGQGGVAGLLQELKYEETMVYKF